MKGNWKVSYNPMLGDAPYVVVRIIDTNCPEHSGNREYGSEYLADKASAQKIADELNEEATK
ncbi:MAG: hypothetical protein RRZ68_07755 [Oscillospiraceae bacterium]